MAGMMTPRHLKACITLSAASRCVASAASPGPASTSSPVDQMVEYAFGQRQANPNMAIDVLMSGLSYIGSGTDPLGAARLHLTIAQLEADRDHWAKAQTHASSAMTLAGSGAPTAAAAAELAVTGSSLATRALLIAGQDAEAAALAAQCEQALRPRGPSGQPTDPPASSSASSSPSSSPAANFGASAGYSSPYIRSVGLLALASRAAPQAATGAANAEGGGAEGRLASLIGHPDPAVVLRQDPDLADAVHALGLLRAAGRKEDVEAAARAFTAAAEATAAVRAAAAAAAPPTVGAAAATEWFRRQRNAEVEADSLTGQAQLQMWRREWGEAEERLGEALKAEEAARGERSPSLAPLLTLLGYTYSRSARVTFAEGLFREAAKLLRLDPGRQQGPQAGPQLVRAVAEAGVHASVGAVLAWRYAQLLWVLPNRGGEADRWEAFARHFWAASGGGLAGSDIEGVLGGKGHLKGEGPEGSGVLVSTRFRRAWPCAA